MSFLLHMAGEGLLNGITLCQDGLGSCQRASREHLTTTQGVIAVRREHTLSPPLELTCGTFSDQAQSRCRYLALALWTPSHAKSGNPTPSKTMHAMQQPSTSPQAHPECLPGTAHHSRMCCPHPISSRVSMGGLELSQMKKVLNNALVVRSTPMLAPCTRRAEIF